MIYKDFIKDFNYHQEKSPSYRLGQHFINVFIKDEDDELIGDLWNKSGTSAVKHINRIIETYQWDYNDLPVKDSYK